MALARTGTHTAEAAADEEQRGSKSEEDWVREAEERRQERAAVREKELEEEREKEIEELYESTLTASLERDPDDENQNAEVAAGGKKKKVTAAQLRVQKGERPSTHAHRLPHPLPWLT